MLIDIFTFMKLHVLHYYTIDNYVEKRQPFRPAHFDHIKAYIDRGEIIMGGAYEDPADEAIIVFNGDDTSIAEQFAQSDPYVKNGLVKEYRIRVWNEVVRQHIMK